MKKKEKQELRIKKIEDLRKLLLTKKEEITVSMAKFRIGQEKNSRKVKNLRREIAVISSIIREMEIAKEQTNLKEQKT